MSLQDNMQILHTTGQMSKDTFKELFDNATVAREQTLRDSIEGALCEYFKNLDGQMVSDVYNLVLSEVEPPLLKATMQYTGNNQTKASTVLGMNRGTLRKKLKQYDLL